MNFKSKNCVFNNAKQNNVFTGIQKSAKKKLIKRLLQNFESHYLKTLKIL